MHSGKEIETFSVYEVAKCDNFYTIIIDGEFGYFAGIERL
jgi:hypothetical protein